ncbi:MAG: PilX N-terminal domain-containing pilus assembly protein [Syntrophomonadaceae bacterium]|nr:PilX N-terminal domain-containing pilus assembly protein [Syntrophomonadaceae bacterium]
MSELRHDRERGSIMLMALLLLLLVSCLGYAVIELGLIEYKSSRYDYQAAQAQQAVDAGVDWGLESIYTELTLPANLTAPALPAELSCGNQTIGLETGAKTCEIAVENIINKSVQTGPAGSCTCEFTITATFEGACRQVAVQAVYYFNGGYQYINADGDPAFMPREYLNRGKIVYYQILI